MWLSGVSARLRSKESLVLFTVRAHAWVAGQVPSRGRTRGNHTLLALSLPLSLKTNKIFKKKRQLEENETDLKKEIWRKEGLGHQLSGMPRLKICCFMKQPKILKS